MKFANNLFVTIFFMLGFSGYLFAATADSNVFTADKNFIYCNGEKFVVKGITYNPEYPGEFPWDISNTEPLANTIRRRIASDIADIKKLNINTIRIYENPVCIYEYARNNGLYIYQSIWVDSGFSDLQLSDVKEKQKAYIRHVIDRLHNVHGVDYSDMILAYSVGNEFSDNCIQTTDRNNPAATNYQGHYISAPEGSTPTECFIAEMADYVKTYEHDKYGCTHLVTYANHVGTDMAIKCGFLDIVSFNGYSNSVPQLSNNAPGSRTGTHYQGWLEKLKGWYPNIPVLVTEFGLSTCPGLPRTGPPNYDYGGNTEDDQAAGIAQMWQDITTARVPLAGGCIFEYNDGWWMVSNSVDDKNTHDRNDGEEWFGLISLEGISPTDFKIKKKKAWYMVQEMFSK